MNDDGRLHGIGALARRTVVVPVRTLRLWSDTGIVPESTRGAAGHRLYDGRALARVELIVALRGLGLRLGAIRAAVEDRATAAQVAAVHARALDAEIRALPLHRSVLSLRARDGARGCATGCRPALRPGEGQGICGYGGLARSDRLVAIG